MNVRAYPLALFHAALAGVLAGCAAPTPAPAPAPAAPVSSPSAGPPPPLPERPLEFPGFHQTTLPNGVQLVVVEEHDQPVANVSLYIRSGAAAEPAEKTGLAEMVAEVLTKGTEQRTARQISESIEGVGGTLSAFADADYVGVSSLVLSEHLPLAFELLSDVTLRPTFPAEELELARTRSLSALQVELSQPGSVAQRRFAAEVYGPRHPYSRAALPQTVRAIDRDDLLAFHRAHFRADNALLVVSGDVEAARVEELARRHLGGWAGQGAPLPSFAEPPAREAAHIYLVHRPGSVQSNILVGHVGIRPDNPDYYPLQVLNKILGSGADSRLFAILREQKGWTYGAYSRLSRPRDVGYFVASAEVRTEVTDSALSEMLAQLRRMREEPVTADELAAAKSYLIGSFPLRIETPGQIASQVAQTLLLGLPVEALTRYRERIAAVGAADVQRVARQYVRPDQAAIVVVGDASRVLESLEGIAPITLTDVEGNPLQRSAFEVRASSERFDASGLRPGTRTYRILAQGNPVGSATTTLAREGDHWVVTSSIPVMGQESELRFRDDLTPVAARQVVAQGPVRAEVELRVADGRLSGSASFPPQMGGERTFDTELVTGTLLPGMDEWVIATAELAEGRELTLPQFDPVSGSVANVAYRVTGTETVTVPAGTFEAYRIEVSGGPQPMVLFARRSAPHLVVKQEISGQPVSFELESER